MKKIYFLIGVVFILCLGATSTNDWDENSPDNSTNAVQIDDEIRKLRTDVRERLAIDHDFDDSDTGSSDLTTIGQHEQVTFKAPRATPDLGANQGMSYTKDVNSKAEFHFCDEDDNEVQLTSGGKPSIDNGELIALADTVVRRNTSAGADTGYIALTGGGENAEGRGARILLYGDEHLTNPGLMILYPGYTSGTTRATISVNSARITGLADPSGDQDAATMAFVNATTLAAVAEYAMKYDGSTEIANGAVPTTWTNLDIAALASLTPARYLIILKVLAVGADSDIIVRTDGETDDLGFDGAAQFGGGISGCTLNTGNIAYVSVITSATGVIEWKRDVGDSAVVTLMSYQKMQ